MTKLDPKKAFLLQIQFEGNAFHGSAPQPHTLTVHQACQKGLEVILKQPFHLLAASRLDRGVHAEDFWWLISSLSPLKPLDFEKTKKKLNGWFAFHHPAITVLQVAPALFHPLRESQAKWYRYQIALSREIPLSLSSQTFWQRPHPTFSLKAFSQALKCFEGTHNFQAFRNQGCQNPQTQKTLFRIRCQQHVTHPHCFAFDFIGKSFLKQMIRLLVGSAWSHTLNQISLLDIQKSLLTGSPLPHKFCAPAQGLTLKHLFFTQTPKGNQLAQKQWENPLWSTFEDPAKPKKRPPDPIESLFALNPYHELDDESLYDDNQKKQSGKKNGALPKFFQQTPEKG